MKEYIKKMNSNLLVPPNTLSQSLVVWKYLIGPIYFWHTIIVIMYSFALGGELPTLVGYWTILTLCLLEMVSTSRFSFHLQRTKSLLLFHADSPFFDFLQCLWGLPCDHHGEFHKCMFSALKDALQALQNCKNCLQTLNILFAGNLPSVWGQLRQFVLSHGCQDSANHCR